MARKEVVLDRKLPQAPEAEMQLLGAILFDPTMMGTVAEIVKPDDFRESINRKIADAIWALWNDGKPIDAGLVFEELKKQTKGKAEGHYGVLVKIADAVPDASHAEHYARIIADKAMLRGACLLSEEMVKASYAGDAEPEAVLEAFGHKLFALSERLGADGAEAIGGLLEEEFRKLEATAPGSAVMAGLPTGYFELDEILGGLKPGDMVVIAARPSHGKTSLAMNIAEHVTIEHGKPAAFFSIEVSRDRFAGAMLCSHARVDARCAGRGYASEQDRTRLQTAISAMREAPLYIDDDARLTPFALRNRARLLKMRHGIEIVFVDYLQLVRPGKNPDGSKWHSREHEVAYMSHECKALAKELNLPVVVLSQLNRQSEQRDDRRPRLAELRESGAVEQDADVVILLYRADMNERDSQKHTGIVNVNVAKQRHGPTGYCKLLFKKEYTRFENLAKRPEGEQQYRAYKDAPEKPEKPEAPKWKDFEGDDDSVPF